MLWVSGADTGLPPRVNLGGSEAEPTASAPSQ